MVEIRSLYDQRIKLVEGTKPDVWRYSEEDVAACFKELREFVQNIDNTREQILAKLDERVGKKIMDVKNE